MKSADIIESLNNLMSADNKIDDNKCILVSGDWGIGKTYTVQKWAEQNVAKYNVKSISAFGKPTARDIENAIITQLLNIFDYEVNAHIRGIGKLFKDIILKPSSKLSGINLDLTEYIKYISIEDVFNIYQKIVKRNEVTNLETNKKTIICIDDLERKSDFKIVDLLGLIERAKQNYNVIIIANTHEFEEEDKKKFSEYNEKVVDYELKITGIDNDLKLELANEVFDEFHLNQEELKLIIEEFDRKLINNESNLINDKINNLRIFKRYVSLVYKVLHLKNNEIKTEEFFLDKEILKSCKLTIFEYYFPTLFHESKNNKTKTSTTQISNLEENKVLKKLFLGEHLSSDNLKILVPPKIEINKDIKTINRIYEIKQEEVNNLLRKLKSKIRTQDLDYFTDQYNVVSLYDALVSYGSYVDYEMDLLEIAKKLYIPNSHKNFINENPYEWYRSYLYGEPLGPFPETAEFIQELTNYNLTSEEQYKKNKINQTLKEKDIEGTLEAINKYNNFDKQTLQKVFDLGWEALDSLSHEAGWALLEKFIERMGNNSIDDFIKGQKSEERTLLDHSRINYLKDLSYQYSYYQESIREQSMDKS